VRIRPVIRIGPFVITPGGRRATAPRPGRVRLRGSDLAVLALAAGMLTFILVMAVVTG
jgi:hypothetical protein